MRLAAIDIGSNAARLLVSEVLTQAADKPLFSKLNLVRVPLRLGFDVFETGRISPERATMMIHTMKAFRELIDAYGVPLHHLKACATSAMRDAANSAEIARQIQEETGIAIEIISGSFEAAIIYENHIAENLDDKNAYLYIDVGGGSTELTFFAKGKLVFKESFNIGTIRLLKNQVSDKGWDAVKTFLKKNTKGYSNIQAIGSGGNINKIFSLSKKKDGKPVLLEELKTYYNTFNILTVSERMRQYDLREDRADVIVPALQIFINVMRWVNANEVYVPKIGLADGLIQHLYYQLTMDNEQ
jgi:exopolyphosphatase / guanosine-5'-triphosphate,3'-diphosphate pyrophosphatase